MIARAADASAGDEPVEWVDELGTWIVRGADAAREALRAPELSSAWAGAATRLHGTTRHAAGDATIGRWFMFLDDEAHATLRGCVAKLFNAASIRRLEPAIDALVADRLDGARGTIDVVAQLATPLSGGVVCRVLGIPPDTVHRLEPLSDAIADYLRRDYLSPVADAGESALRELDGIARGALEDAREDDGTAAAALRDAVAAGTIDAADAAATLTLLVYAGFETTSTFLATAVYETLTRGLLVDCRDRGSAAALVDELLRLFTSVPQVARVCRAPLMLRGHVLGARELVLVRLGEANRDPSGFCGPRDLDSARRERSLAFGYGAHYCLGAQLARVEAAILLEALAARFPAARVVRERTDVQAGEPRSFRRLEVDLG